MGAGDLNGFLGLALDNVTQLVILSSLLVGVFGFPADLVLQRMVPDTALGVLVGDLVYTWLAVRLMQKTGRDDVTAMLFGIDAPTLFAMVFGVLGPVKLATGNAQLATVIAGMCGGVVQNTPYIGHPAYKAMGARAGYTLATGLVIGVGAVLGGLAVLVGVLPEAAVAPILVFIGLEITAQGFLASPARHGAAVALSFVPVAAAVVLIQLGSLLGASTPSPGDPAHTMLLVLGNGFILTAVLWAWALAAIIDRRFRTATVVFAVASVASLFGLIHSPLAGGALFWPWTVVSSLPHELAGAYGLLAVITCAAAQTASRRAHG